MPFQFPNEEKTRIIIACVPPKFVLAECGTTNFYTTMTQPLRLIVEALLYFLRILFLFTFSSVRCDDFASECMVRVKEKKNCDGIYRKWWQQKRRRHQPRVVHSYALKISHAENIHMCRH